MSKLVNRIQSGIETVKKWESELEDKALLSEVRSLIPFDVLCPEDFYLIQRRAVAAALLRKAPTTCTGASQSSIETISEQVTSATNNPYFVDDDDLYESDDLLLKRLALFFQKSFMKWVNNPPCSICGSTETQCQGTRGAETLEEHDGGASRVELYYCPNCDGLTTCFPRFNNPRTLLQTRKGRCGEFANLFGFICRALGFEARYVLDFTDHVWVEVWSSRLSRWIMADSCEGKIDAPSMYEKGWGKKLDYIVAFTSDSVVDVTKRYTRVFHTTDFQNRRRLICPSEFESAHIIGHFNATLRREGRLMRSLEELERRASEEKELLDSTSRKSWEVDSYSEGRVSGSLAWRVSRGEVGHKGELGITAALTSVDSQESHSISMMSLNNIIASPKAIEVETFSPTISDTLHITVRSRAAESRRCFPECITVSGVNCGGGIDGTISIIVIDERTACILLSRLFYSWSEALSFISFLPDERIIALVSNCSAHECEETFIAENIKRISHLSLNSIAMHGRSDVGLESRDCSMPSSERNKITRDPLNDIQTDLSGAILSDAMKSHIIQVEPGPIRSADNNHKTLLYIGQINLDPSWAICEFVGPGVSLGVSLRIIEGSSSDELELVSNKGVVPHRIAGRLPDYVMPLHEQVKADNITKQKAFLSYTSKQGKNNDYVGFTSKKGVPIYLMKNSSMPLQRYTNSGVEWETNYFVPKAISQMADQTASVYQIPINESFFSSLIGSMLLRKQHSVPIAATLNNKRLIAFYFSAHWCPPCRQFTPMLCEFYNHINETMPTALEIVFISSDRDSNGFDLYFGQMPWVAVPYESMKSLNSLSARFSVTGIPALVVFDALSGEIVVTSDRARADVANACQFGPQAIENLVQSWINATSDETKMIIDALQLSSFELYEEADRKRHQNFLFRNESSDLVRNEYSVTYTRIEPVFPDDTIIEDIARYPDLIIKYVSNARRDPSCPKYRSIRLSNKVFDRITSSDRGIDLIIRCGFHVHVTDVDYIASIPLAANLELMLQETQNHRSEDSSL